MAFAYLNNAYAYEGDFVKQYDNTIYQGLFHVLHSIIKDLLLQYKLVTALIFLRNSFLKQVMNYSLVIMIYTHPVILACYCLENPSAWLR